MISIESGLHLFRTLTMTGRTWIAIVFRGVTFSTWRWKYACPVDSDNNDNGKETKRLGPIQISQEAANGSNKFNTHRRRPRWYTLSRPPKSKNWHERIDSLQQKGIVELCVNCGTIGLSLPPHGDRVTTCPVKWCAVSCSHHAMIDENPIFEFWLCHGHDQVAKIEHHKHKNGEILPFLNK